MVGINSAAKGRVAEREVARLCQTWWRRIESDCEFVRTPLSGGWAGASVRGHFRASGDLMTTANHWPFTVEVKRRECWNVSRLFYGKSCPVWPWWRQTVVQACEENGVPMLWARKNQYRPGQPSFPWLVMIASSYICSLRNVRLPRPDVIWTADQLQTAKIDYCDELPVLWFADKFLSTNPRSWIRR